MRTEELKSSRFEAVDFDPFREGAIENLVPLTEPQFEVWASSQMGDAASCAYNESCSVRLTGAIQLVAMQRALQELMARHESLRASFSADGRHILVNETMALDIAMDDLRVFPQTERAARLREITAAEVTTPFDLRQGPLFRARIIYVDDGEQWVVMTAHHIVCDGWSSAILVQDLGAIYTALLENRTVNLPAPQSFVEYAWRQQEHYLGSDRAAQEEYWRRQFLDEAPILELPIDKKRPPQRTYRSERLDIPLSESLLQNLRKAGAMHGASLVVTMLSAFNVWLHRISGQNDLVVGVPAAGQALEGLHRLIGHCVHLLPVRSSVDPQQSFVEYLKTMRRTMLDAYDHQRLTFSKLLHQIPIERDPSRPPLVSVMFNVDQKIESKDLSFPDCGASYFANPRAFENFELFINAAEFDGRMTLECQYNADLFSSASMERYLNAFVSLLESIAQNPSELVGRLKIISPEERAKIVYGMNETGVEFPGEKGIHELIAETARLYPERTAAIFGDETLKYFDLERTANQIAQRLVAMGVRPGDLVGLAVERSLEMLSCMLGILKAGAAYVPLDPAYPEDRLSHMLSASGLKVVVTQSALIKELPSHEAAILAIDAERFSLAKLSDRAPVLEGFTSEHTAYVIYTSGSTGRPKGVRVPHRAVVNFLNAMQKRPGLTENDTMMAVTTLSFDIAVLELYLPLMTGARVVIASREMASDGDALYSEMQRHEVSVMQATPATWRMLLEVGWEGNPQLRILCGGEALPRDLMQELVPRVKVIWNMYGPTETTVWSTCYEITAEKQPILVGKPIDNTQVYILDAYVQPVPLGVTGEVYIGGDGVAQGYLGRPDLTAERFFEDPFVPGGKIYRTGDLARYTASGDIEYLRRNDQQVKIRGFRIELGEVQSVLASHPAAHQAVVIVREDRPGDKRLVGYFKPNFGVTVNVAELVAHMRRELPPYMVTHEIVMMESFPLLPNGKLNLKALPAPENGSVGEEYVEPRNEMEQKIARIWCEEMGRERISVTANFFSLGGHSLIATRIMSRIKKTLEVEVSLKHLFAAPTVALLTEYLGGANDTVAEAIPVYAGEGAVPLAMTQERLWLLETLTPGTGVNAMPAGRYLHGALNIDALERSINAFIRRHSVMRMRVGIVDHKPVQIYDEHKSFSLQVVDLESVPTENRQSTLDDLLLAAAIEPMDIERGPLFVIRLYRLNAEHHALFFMFHHVIWDGWCFDLFLKEVGEFYAHFASGAPLKQKELPIQYKDFAPWHREYVTCPEAAKQLSYWREQLQAPLGVLEIPTDKPRPPVMTYAADRVSFLLSKKQVDLLNQLASREGATLFMVFLSAYYALLRRLSGQEDLVIGSPVQGRIRPELEDMVGYFVNTLALRVRVQAGMTFKQLIHEVMQVTLGALNHQDTPFESLLTELNPPRDPSRPAIYSVLFSYQDVSKRPLKWDDLHLTVLDVMHDSVTTDFNLWMRKGLHGVEAGIDFRTDLYERETIEQFVAVFRNILEAMTYNPETAVDAALLGSSPEIHERSFALKDKVLDLSTEEALPRGSELARFLQNHEAKSFIGSRHVFLEAARFGFVPTEEAWLVIVADTWSDACASLHPNMAVSFGDVFVSFDQQKQCFLACKGVRVCDDHGQGLPAGVAGEVYVNDKKTGVMARMDAEGFFHILGTIDHRRDLGGFRIQAERIETALLRSSEVSDAVVRLRRHPESKELELGAFITPVDGAALSLRWVQKQLKDVLPAYLIPHYVVNFDRLPLNARGWTDEDKLPWRADLLAEDADYVAPRSYAEKQLAAIWQEVLKVERISATDNFFDRGGYSLLPLLVINRVAEQTGTRIPLRLFLTNTLEQIAPHCGFREEVVGEEVTDAAMERTIEPLFFGDENSPLFGVYHKPRGAMKRSAAVLLCYPGAEEYMRSHWALRQLAQNLSRAGFAVLRFDYFGSGDSSGATDAGTCARWIEDIKVATAKLAELSGQTAIHIVGLRLGATLAARAVSQGLRAESLVLWDPVVDGFEYLMDLSQMHQQLVEFDNRPPYASKSELIQFSEAVGFPMNDQLKRELKTLQLDSLDWNLWPKTYIVHAEERVTYRYIPEKVRAHRHVQCQFIADAGHWGDYKQLRLAFFPNQMIQAISAWLGGRA